VESNGGIKREEAKSNCGRNSNRTSDKSGTESIKSELGFGWNQTADDTKTESKPNRNRTETELEVSNWKLGGETSTDRASKPMPDPTDSIPQSDQKMLLLARNNIQITNKQMHK